MAALVWIVRTFTDFIGCVSTNSDGTPNENGMIYRFLVKPLGNLITMLVENFDCGLMVGQLSL